MLETKDIKKIALVTGYGKFPIFICHAAKEQNIEIVVIAIRGEADVNLAKHADKIYWIELGEGRKLLEILKKESIKYAVMAGKINKITIFKQTFKMDEVARDVLAKVIDRRDNTILQAIAGRLKTEGIRLLDSTKFLKGLLPKKGIFTKKRPTHLQKEDIDFGFKIAKTSAEMDIGQTVIVKDKAVIAVEAIEGTDEAIIRSGKLSKDCIIVKVARINHDNRFDVPTVGLTTIDSMKKAHAAVLAIEAEKTLVMEKETMIKEADKAGVCIVAV